MEAAGRRETVNRIQTPRRQGGAAALALLAALAAAPAAAPAAAQVPRRIVVTAVTAQLEVGRATQLTAVVLGPRRDTLRMPVRWTSSDTAKARVGVSGVVLAKDTGTVTIVAEAGAIRASARLGLVPAHLSGAGDIGACGLPGARQTGALLERLPGTVFAAGDIAYPNGTHGQFASCYDPFWGRLKARTRPVPGNHDYRIPGAAAYYDYFGAAAGERGKGWYAYDLGGWRIYALNSNVAEDAGSEQEAWLRADLRAHPRLCTLAYWHHARFSSGPHGTSTRTAALFHALYDAGADVLLVGHDHDYERFTPQSPTGAADPPAGSASSWWGQVGGRSTPSGRLSRIASSAMTPGGGCSA